MNVVGGMTWERMAVWPKRLLKPERSLTVASSYAKHANGLRTGNKVETLRPVDLRITPVHAVIHPSRTKPFRNDEDEWDWRALAEEATNRNATRWNIVHHSGNNQSGRS